MTAGSGIIHEEFHSKDFAKEGGNFEIIQLWVNLPQQFKMTAPRYQAIKNEDVPIYTLDNNAGIIRVIAGNYKHLKAPAVTFSPVTLWDMKLQQVNNLTFNISSGDSAALFVLKGKIDIDGQVVNETEIALLENKGEIVCFSVRNEAHVLFLGGQVINEPIIGSGPFVMNSAEEIEQAFQDFRSGKMGNLK